MTSTQKNVVKTGKSKAIKVQVGLQSSRQMINDKISRFRRWQLVIVIASMIIGWGTFFYFLPTVSDALDISSATSLAFWLFVVAGAYLPSMLFKLLKDRILRCPGCGITFEKLGMITNLERPLVSSRIWLENFLTKESKIDESASNCRNCGLHLDSNTLKT